MKLSWRKARTSYDRQLDILNQIHEFREDLNSIWPRSPPTAPTAIPRGGGFLLELRSCLDQVHYWFELPLSISICTGNEDSALKMEGVERIKKILIEKGARLCAEAIEPWLSPLILTDLDSCSIARPWGITLSFAFWAMSSFNVWTPVFPLLTLISAC